MFIEENFNIVYSFSAIRVKCCSVSFSVNTLKRYRNYLDLSKHKRWKTNRNLTLSFVTTPISISFGFKSVESTLANVEIANYKNQINYQDFYSFLSLFTSIASS